MFKNSKTGGGQKFKLASFDFMHDTLNSKLVPAPDIFYYDVHDIIYSYNTYLRKRVQKYSETEKQNLKNVAFSLELLHFYRFAAETDFSIKLRTAREYVQECVVRVLRVIRINRRVYT